MYVTTSEEMRALDKTAIEKYGLPGIVLMENAARSVAEAALKRWPDFQKSLILAGPGQNGGDGWALARILSAAGKKVAVLSVCEPGKTPQGDAAINRQVTLNLKLPVLDANIDEVPWPDYDLLVDAVFGTGLSRPLSGLAAAVIKEAALIKVSRPEFKTLAVDLPSGLSADTGQALGPVIKADLTVTLGHPKLGLYLTDGPQLAGEIVVGDIGLHQDMTPDQGSPAGRLMDIEQAKTMKPHRPINGHKGTFGHAVIMGGSLGHCGALALAAQGAQAAGTGLVTTAAPSSLAPVLAAKLTSPMTLGLPEDEPGYFSQDSADHILKFAENKEVLALGPGLGLNAGAEGAVLDIWLNWPKTLVLDADALTIIGANNVTPKPDRLTVLTPHPGEAGRLLGCRTLEVEQNRLAAAKAIAARYNAVAVLKGPHTITAEPGGRFWLNTTGGQYLAVGGSGDLLTGLIAGLLAQNLPLERAAALGVFIHGLAADLAAESLGPFGLTPEQFAAYVPKVWQRLY